MNKLSDFFEALNKEEEKFIPILASDNLGLLMRFAINELDWFDYNFVREKQQSDDQIEQLYILQLGVARFIKLALEARQTFDVPVVTTVRRREITLPVLEIASALGMIQHGRRVAQTVAQGIGSLEKLRTNEFIITLPKEITDDEYYEREVRQYYNAESRRLFSEATKTDEWKEIEKQVNLKLTELVYPFEKNFIGYDADPILDDYFFGLASHEISLQEGYDTYHYQTRFGGISMQSYMLALTFLVAMSIRHERFSEALVTKESNIRLENILTISSDIEPLIESIKDSVNHYGVACESFESINVSQARQIFDTLSFNRENTSFLDAPGSPFPHLVQCSDTGVIRSIYGANAEPVRYLLDSLRFLYPKDYNQNQRGREGSMQRAIKRVLNDAFNGLDYRENIKMRVGECRLSDIDLVVLEKSTGVVLLCQLKHQELYGQDLHAKYIRANRLKAEVGDWLAAVDSWTSVKGTDGIKSSLRLPKSFPEPQLYHLVISRHFSYPLKDIVLADQSTYTNWIHFFNATELVKHDSSERQLLLLISKLKEIQCTMVTPAHLPEPRSKWTIDQLVFVTKQDGEKSSGI